MDSETRKKLLQRFSKSRTNRAEDVLSNTNSEQVATDQFKLERKIAGMLDDNKDESFKEADDKSESRMKELIRKKYLNSLKQR